MNAIVVNNDYRLLESLDTSKVNDIVLITQINRFISIIATIMAGFDNKSNNKGNITVFEAIGLPFISQNIEFFCACLQVFKNNSRIVNSSVRLLRTVVKLCEKHLTEFFDLLLNTILVVFEANPIENSSILSLLLGLLFTVDYYDKQRQWIENNFRHLLKFLITKATENKDPDLLKYFVTIQNKTFEKYREFLLGLDEFEEIIDFVLMIFLNVNETILQKEILTFFQLTFGTKSIITNQKILKNVQKFIEALLIMLPDVFRRSRQNVNFLENIVYNIYFN